MNKIIIPTILAATVLIVAIFSLMPVDKATTIHSSVLVVSTTLTNSTNSTSLVGDKYHHFILSSSEPFTIHDITVKGEITGTTDSGHKIRVTEIGAYPDEYGNDPQSAVDDDRLNDVCDDCDSESSEDNVVVDGNDSKNPQTWSMNSVDANNSVGELGFGPSQNIVVEICFKDGAGGDPNMTAMVTFHLKGVEDGDVSVKVNENVSQISGGG